VQIWEAARSDLTDLDAQMESGEFGTLRDWLGDKLYRWGRRYPPEEMLERVAGSPLNADPYIGYLKSKVSEIYGVRV
jgi:carboxypeptidase Taq